MLVDCMLHLTLLRGVVSQPTMTAEPWGCRERALRGWPGGRFQVQPHHYQLCDLGPAMWPL